jgi:hypothetical protein
VSFLPVRFPEGPEKGYGTLLAILQTRHANVIQGKAYNQGFFHPHGCLMK